MNGAGRAVFAAAVIRECRAALAARGGDVLREAVGNAGAIADWRHYPNGDGFDPSSHAQYFFHRHPERDRAPAGSRAESGHFHLFLRAEGMPAGVAPLLLPEVAIANLPTLAPQAAPRKRGARDEVSHLIAIALDDRGAPVRLFTTNRWVTGETWYRAEDVIAMLDRFVVEVAEPSPVLNRWLGAMVRLYQPEIAMLLRQRDAAVMDPKRRRRRLDVFEDPRLEETSSQTIDLDARLAAVERLGHEWTSGAPAAQPSRLPPMAEGWGS